MSEINRRDFVKTTAMSLAGTVFLGSAPNAFAEDGRKDSAMLIRSFLAEHKAKVLSFDPKKLNGISEKMIQSHWENNYQGSIKNLNGTRKKLAEALSNKDTPPFLYAGLKREHLMRTGSVIYHEMYFSNLGGSGKAGGSIQKTLVKEFGSVENWEGEFRKIAQSLGGGSGWVVLGWNLHLGLLENYWLADHLHGTATVVPLLVMDMYEHSYQIDYGAIAAKYIDAFFLNINWDEVERRSERALKLKWT